MDLPMIESIVDLVGSTHENVSETITWSDPSLIKKEHEASRQANRPAHVELEWISNKQRPLVLLCKRLGQDIICWWIT